MAKTTPKFAQNAGNAIPTEHGYAAKYVRYFVQTVKHWQTRGGK